MTYDEPERDDPDWDSEKPGGDITHSSLRVCAEQKDGQKSLDKHHLRLFADDRGEAERIPIREADAAV